MTSAAIRSPLSQARLQEVVAGLAACERQWLGLVRYTEETRWYKRLIDGGDHEVWPLSWLPGQGTGFHDHGGSAGAFAVARGALQEWTAPGGRPSSAGVTKAQPAVMATRPPRSPLHASPTSGLESVYRT